MADPKPTDTDAAREAAGVASTADNAQLEHTRGGATTRDAMDAGVPMIPGSPSEPVGPEDALGPGPKRGDYSDRVSSGPSMATRTIPEDERRDKALANLKSAGVKDPSEADIGAALGDVPAYELVPQAPNATLVGDTPGKGGVSTPEAQEAAAR